MNAPKVTTSMTEGQALDAKCEYTQYTNTATPDVADKDPATTLPKCGFNSDDKAYCPQMMGNDNAVNAFKAYAD